MAIPSSQRLNSTTLKKDFQLVTFEGLGKGWTRISTGWEPGSPFVWYWIGNTFSPALFLPFEIRSYGHIRIEPCKEDRASYCPILSRSDWKMVLHLRVSTHGGRLLLMPFFHYQPLGEKVSRMRERVCTESLPALSLSCVVLPISECYSGCGWSDFSSLSSWFHDGHWF